MYNLTESILVGATLLSAFMPETCTKVSQMLGAPLKDFDSLDEFGTLTTTTVTKTPEILFARLDGAKIMEQVNAMIEERKAKATESAPAEVKAEEKKEEVEMIDINDFAKVKLGVALVTACEKVEKSKKLLKLTVKLGDEERTVVSGIANAYAPEDLIGKKITMVTNLKPAKLCGILSEGMILCAEGADGTLSVLSPEKDVEDGSSIS